MDKRKFSLVLSGGGLKGLSHVGVFRALEEHGMAPSLVVGSSMGSLIAAAWAAGLSAAQMSKGAANVRRKDVFRVAHADMAAPLLICAADNPAAQAAAIRDPMLLSRPSPPGGD